MPLNMFSGTRRALSRVHIFKAYSTLVPRSASACSLSSCAKPIGSALGIFLLPTSNAFAEVFLRNSSLRALPYVGLGLAPVIARLLPIGEILAKVSIASLNEGLTRHICNVTGCKPVCPRKSTLRCGSPVGVASMITIFLPAQSSGNYW